MKDIFSYMSQDHARCMDQFDLVCDYVGAGDWQRATEEVKELAVALNRHIHIEEELIFSAVLSLVNSPDVPASLMRTEHARLIGYIDHLAAAVFQQQAAEFSKFSAMFKVLLQLHFDKEHGRFYPLARCVLAPQRERLNAALASFNDSNNTSA